MTVNNAAVVYECDDHDCDETIIVYGNGLELHERNTAHELNIKGWFWVNSKTHYCPIHRSSNNHNLHLYFVVRDHVLVFSETTRQACVDLMSFARMAAKRGNVDVTDVTIRIVSNEQFVIDTTTTDL